MLQRRQRLLQPRVLLPWAPAFYMDPNPEAAAQKSETLSTISTFDTIDEKAGIAILALSVRDVWQAPCLCPYVTERTHAEDFDD